MIGCDILEFERIPQDAKFLERVLTENEKKYIEKFEQKNERIAGIFCAKEAVFKALNLQQIRYQEIEISRNENGRPLVTLYGHTNEFFKKNYQTIDLSVSHSKTVAMAVCEIH